MRLTYKILIASSQLVAVISAAPLASYKKPVLVRRSEFFEGAQNIANQARKRARTAVLEPPKEEWDESLNLDAWSEHLMSSKDPWALEDPWGIEWGPETFISGVSSDITGGASREGWGEVSSSQGSIKDHQPRESKKPVPPTEHHETPASHDELSMDGLLEGVSSEEITQVLEQLGQNLMHSPDFLKTLDLYKVRSDKLKENAQKLALEGSNGKGKEPTTEEYFEAENDKLLHKLLDLKEQYSHHSHETSSDEKSEII